jgi:hypothetical protein
VALRDLDVARNAGPLEDAAPSVGVGLPVGPAAAENARPAANRPEDLGSVPQGVRTRERTTSEKADPAPQMGDRSPNGVDREAALLADFSTGPIVTRPPWATMRVPG